MYIESGHGKLTHGEIAAVMLDTMEDGFIMKSTSSKDTTAYKAGRRAFFEPSADCHYLPYSIEYEDWWQGYDDARRESKQ